MFTFMKKIFLIFISLITVFSFSSVSIAQSILPSQNISLGITISPTYPKAGNDVNLTLTSPSSDIDAAKITWYLNGSAKESGIGQKTFFLTLGNTGSKTTVKAVAELQNGKSIEVTRDIVPEEIDFVLESNTYVPPFYKGKPSLSSQGEFKIIAIPDIIEDGGKISADNLIFKWKKNGSSLLSDSGAGKNVLGVTTSLLDQNITISLDVYDSNLKKVTSDEKIISINDPEIIFYENSALYGMLYNQAITSSYGLGNREELDIVAKPYYFSDKTQTSDLKYKWRVNGGTVVPAGNQNELLLRQTSTSGNGNAQVSLDIKSLTKIFQAATNNFNVNFGQ